MIRTHAPALRMRGLGGPMILAATLLIGIGAVAFVAQRPPQNPLPAERVADLAEISTMPMQIHVVMARGLDRLIQRRDVRFGSCPGIGCPGAGVLRPTPIFLVRDEDGVIHAFIGEDPKTGCAIEWRGEWEAYRTQGVFHDVCHGSIYDRRGKIAGGPSPWDLNQIGVEIRGDDVYVHPSQIIVGESRL